jgi:beta-galactosidase
LITVTIIRVLTAVGCLLALASQAQMPRNTTEFDHGWLFQQSDAGGAQEPAFADAGWVKVELPHDWAIAGPFEASNPSGGAGAFAPAGIGWYRRHFTLAETDAKKRVFVEFDGVMANSDVWINGFHLGHRPNGYVSFRYELTDHLKFGKDDNVLAVKADNSKQPSSRFYEGAGIYRHVRLLVMNPIHVAQDSTFISASDVTAATATVHIETAVFNQSDASADVALRATITDPAGKVVAEGNLPPSALGALQQETLKFTIKVKNPDRWDLDHPALYHAVVEPMVGGRPVDADAVNFGIREFHFDPDTGFWLNGKNFKIDGVALHADDSSMGMAVPVGAWEHRLLAMKALGANAIRTAHNPVAPEFLDLCDRMGFLVMDEMFDMWTVAKNPYDYHLYFRDWYLIDTRDTVRRDRNHPSVILWSAGNEIHDTPNAELAKEILGNLVKVFHEFDPTRPVTQALFRPNVSHDYDDGLADLLDVIGQNYRPNEILAAHTQKPSRKIIGTENTHDREQWLAVRDHPPYSGMFVWAGTDYLGESRHWPVIADSSGLDDRTDAQKPDGMERQSWWLTTPVVHIVRRVAASAPAATDPGYEPGSPQALALAKGAGAAVPAPAGGGAGAVQGGVPRPTVYADWTPANTAPHDENVEVYSNCAQVELSLNGASQGVKPINADASPRKWVVPYAAGELTAVCKGSEPASETLHTAGKPARLTLTVERGKLSASWDDVGFVRARIVDDHGVVVPYAAVPLTFSVSGPGKILTTDSGDNADHSGFQKPQRNAFRGSAIAIVRATAATGDVTVTVDGAGLTGARATLHIQ